jgi:hypothetical protein
MKLAVPTTWVVIGGLGLTAICHEGREPQHIEQRSYENPPTLTYQVSAANVSAGSVSHSVDAFVSTDWMHKA